MDSATNRVIEPFLIHGDLSGFDTLATASGVAVKTDLGTYARLVG